MITLVEHYNHIGHEINESFANYGKHDREVYCKKLHKIYEPLKKDCESCEYYYGWMMGHGHVCRWPDVTTDGEIEKHILHEDRQKEMMRVSQLISEGVLQKG